MKGKLFIVSAPSGAGKSSLVETVLNNLNGVYSIDRLVTYTSRERRPGEIQGRDFCYVSESEFEVLIETGFFIEWSRDYGCYYGSPKYLKEDLQKGLSRILVIDTNGAKQILNHVPEAVKIWIYVDSVDVLKARLENRGLNTSEQIEKRLMLAQHEIEKELKNNFYENHLLNDVFDDALKKLEKILIKELQIL